MQTAEPSSQVPEPLRGEMTALAVEYLREHFRKNSHGHVGLPATAHIRNARRYAVIGLNQEYMERFRVPRAGEWEKHPYSHSLRAIVEDAAHKLGFERVEILGSRKNYQWQNTYQNR